MEHSSIQRAPIHSNMVADPHWFNADPDTNPDQAFFLIADPDPATQINAVACILQPYSCWGGGGGGGVYLSDPKAEGGGGVVYMSDPKAGILSGEGGKG